MYRSRFHHKMAKLQAEAQSLAEVFNARVRGPAELSLCFLQPVIYEVQDPRQPQAQGGRIWIMAEPELEGRFTKYNNNVGGVSAFEASVNLGAIREEDEEGGVIVTKATKKTVGTTHLFLDKEKGEKKREEENLMEEDEDEEGWVTLTKASKKRYGITAGVSHPGLTKCKEIP